MGSRKKGKRHTASRTESFYPLPEVKELVEHRRVLVRGNAFDYAYRDFGWGESDILDALRRLRPGHFYKTEMSAKKHGVVLDFYKAYGLKGEDVYIHLYIDDEDEVLVVNSFKKV